MRTQEDIREELQFQEWWLNGFLNCWNFAQAKPRVEKKRSDLLSELLEMQLDEFDGVH